MTILISLIMLISLANPFALTAALLNSKINLSGAKEPIEEVTTAPKPQQLWVVVTAYSSIPAQTDDTPFITAKGTSVRDGIVAANFLEFDTKVRLPELFGDKVFTVEDRMHSRFSDRLDIWFPDEESAKRFGRRYTLIEIES